MLHKILRFLFGKNVKVARLQTLKVTYKCA